MERLCEYCETSRGTKGYEFLNQLKRKVPCTIHLTAFIIDKINIDILTEMHVFLFVYQSKN
jgi:hypothetical protein